MAVNDGAWYQAQVGVIGSLLIDPQHTAGLIFQQAREAHFGNAGLQHVFLAARELWADRKPLDSITILHAAGDEYEKLLAGCMEQTPTAANVEEYLRILKSEARMSQIRTVGLGLGTVHSEAEALAVYEQLGLILRDTGTVEDTSFEEAVNEYLDRMNDPNPPNYLSWGISQLDAHLFVSPGDFCVLAADSSVGKTALALQFAYHMAATGKKVLFFSLETSREKLEDRLMAEKQVAGVALPRTKKKALSTVDYRNVVNVGERAGKINLRLIRRADTLAEIRNRIIMHGADVVFIDYLQIINHRASSRYETVTEISLALHRMANSLGVTIVALSQVTPPENGEITIQDMRESGQIKNDAEIILLMMMDKLCYPARRLVIGKDKDGAKNKRLLLDFDAQHMTFSYHKRVQTSADGTVKFEELPDDDSEEVPF